MNSTPLNRPRRPVTHGLSPLIEFVFSSLLALVAPWLCQAAETKKKSSITPVR